MARSAVAVISGVVVAFLAVWLIEGLGNTIYPPPAGLDISDPDQIAAVIDDMPTAALLFPLIAWLLATVTGGLTACIIARSRPTFHSFFVGGLVLLATVFNLLAFPHPAWMVVGAIVGIPAMALFAARVAPTMVRQELGDSSPL